MNKWLILGGDGQLGRCTRAALSSHGVAHECVGRDVVDITNNSSVASCVERVRPTVILNAAAWTTVDDAEIHESDALNVNCEGARNVALAAHLVNALLIHVSTDYVFSGRATAPISENEECSPINAYGRTKLAGEHAVRESHPDSSLIVRTAWLYSDHGRNFARTMVRRALDRQPVRVVNDQFGQPTSAVDLAEHLIALVEKDAPPGTYHGTNEGHASWFDFACRIYALIGSDTSLVSPVTSSEYPTIARRPMYSVLSHGRTREAHVEPMRPWEDALMDAMPQLVAASGVK